MSKCLLPDDGCSCIRLCNSEKEHCLSLLVCGVSENGDVVCVDLVKPDGEVVYCGVDLDLVNVFVKEMGLERI